MIQKVIQIGNSLGVIIPQALNKQLGLRPGDELIVKQEDNTVVLSPKKAREKLSGGVDAKFMKTVDDFIEEHEDVLKELANR